MTPAHTSGTLLPMAPHRYDYTSPLDVLDQEIPYPEWMEADLYDEAYYGDDEPSTPYENGNYMRWI